MEKKTYTKLSELVDNTFTVTKAWGYQFKLWDNESKRMLVSEKYEQGYRKIYNLDTDKGSLDLGSGQLSSLLEAVYKNGTADINGVTFKVKSNGKSGMDIRYYFNVDRDAKPQPQTNQDTVHDVDDGEVISLDDLSQIPF
jgi:hypothetical protein